MPQFIVNNHTLHLALNFNFHYATKFELYRRKDNRHFRFIHYDGKNYEELYSYLQNEECNINIPEKAKLLPGKLFNIDGRNKFTNIPNSSMDFVIAANSYIVRNNGYYNLLFNYDIAQYLLSTYSGIILKTSIEVNSGRSVKYRSPKDLERIPQNTCIKTHRVWFISSEKSINIDLSKIPQSVINSYLQSEDYFQEFEIFKKEDKKGVIAWRTKVIIPPLYSNILIENYRAYLQNDAGYWAEYSLKCRKLKSKFIYSDIQIEAEKGYVTAQKNDKTVILHNPKAKENDLIIKDENGLYGVKNGKKWKIPAEYDYISLWKGSDRFEAFKNGKYGLFNNEGKCLLSCIYEFIDAPTSDMALFKANKNGKWGIVGFNDKIYHDFIIEEDRQLEEEYKNAIDLFININYQHHKFLPLQILTRDFNREFILMRIINCDRCFKIYRNHLPNNTFDKCMKSYLTAVKTLKNLAIRVEKDHKTIIDYTKTTTWLSYRKKVYALKVSEIVNGVIHSIGENNITIQLDNGVYGVIPKNEIDNYSIGEQLSLIIKQIKHTSITLEKYEP